MRRRDFIAGLGGTVAWPVVGRAQVKRTRIGYLYTGSSDAPEMQVNRNALREGLRNLGYTEGQHYDLVERFAAGHIDRLATLATELVSLRVDVIVAIATPAGHAAQQATKTIPIVVANMGDPIQDGLVESLARPGANITGTSFLGPELVPKRLALLKELLPSATRISALWHPGAFSDRTTKAMVSQAIDGAGKLGLQLRFFEVFQPDELEGAFTLIANDRAEALLTFPSTMLFGEQRRLVGLAAQHRLPTMYNAREFVQHGGLMSYGSSIPASLQRAATYVDKILKGAKPSELPVEQPATFELAINLKTARSLQIEVPLFLQQRADELIE